MACSDSDIPKTKSKSQEALQECPNTKAFWTFPDKIKIIGEKTFILKSWSETQESDTQYAIFECAGSESKTIATGGPKETLLDFDTLDGKNFVVLYSDETDQIRKNFEKYPLRELRIRSIRGDSHQDYIFHDPSLAEAKMVAKDGTLKPTHPLSKNRSLFLSTIAGLDTATLRLWNDHVYLAYYSTGGKRLAKWKEGKVEAVVETNPMWEDESYFINDSPNTFALSTDGIYVASEVTQLNRAAMEKALGRKIEESVDEKTILAIQHYDHNLKLIAHTLLTDSKASLNSSKITAKTGKVAVSAEYSIYASSADT